MPFESFNNLFSLISNFFLIHGWYGWSYNLPSWSISTEFYTYLIFALILCNFVNKKILFYLLIILSLIIFLLEHHGFELLTKFVYPARCLYSFFIGSISYYLFKSTKKNISYKLPLIFFLLSLVFISISHNFATNYSYIIAPIIFAFTIIFTAQMSHDNFYYKILSNKFFVYLGSISYGIYMIHFAVVWFFRQTSRFYFNIDEKNNILIFGNYEGILVTIFILTVVIILSHISLNYFENRFRIKK
jgi:peptidoglycan/LPS O-acetylase OafA/YrhL